MTKKSNLLQQYLDIMVDKLTKEGAIIIEKALRTKTYEHRTKNLHDSYGSAVYINGKIVPRSIRVIQPSAQEAKKWYGTYILGSDEILKYLRTAPVKPRGITLLAVAVMPYAVTLENGGYKVISGARSDVEIIAERYKATFKEI